MEKEKRSFPKKEIQEWATDVSQSAREKVTGVATAVKDRRDAASEKSKEKRLEKERELLKPVFLADLTTADFQLPPMICIEDPDEKHVKSPVCKDSIGFKSGDDDLQILHLYPDELEGSGISFYPRIEKAVYFVDNSKTSFYVNLEEYFEFQKKAKIDELEQIASCLGATHVEARLIEQEKSRSVSKRKGGIKISRTMGTSVEAEEEKLSAEKAEVALCTDFAGNNEPRRPVLHYFSNEVSILNLIDMRLNGENTIKSKTYSWDFSHSSGIQEKTAIKIENALKKMKYSVNTSLVSKAMEEKRTMLKYTIKFKTEKQEAEQEQA